MPSFLCAADTSTCGGVVGLHLTVHVPSIPNLTCTVWCSQYVLKKQPFSLVYQSHKRQKTSEILRVSLAFELCRAFARSLEVPARKCPPSHTRKSRFSCRNERDLEGTDKKQTIKALSNWGWDPSEKCFMWLAHLVIFILFKPWQFWSDQSHHC